MKRGARTWRGFIICMLMVAGGSALAASLCGAVGPELATPRSGRPQSIPRPLDVLWSQSPDLNGSRISSEQIRSLGLLSEVANDFTPAQDTRVTKVSWWGGAFNGDPQDPPPTLFNIYFYDDDACALGTQLEQYLAVQPEITPAGEDGAGFTIYKYEAFVNLVVTGGAAYWVVVQADDHVYPPQWGWQQAESVEGCPSLVRSDFFGYPDWTDASQAAGEPWDASLEVHDNTEVVEACCFEDGSCQMLLAPDCEAAGGVPQGIDVDCTPNGCAQPAEEACCLADNTCFMLPPEVCTNAFGIPQGPGSVCEPNPCEQELFACCFLDGSCLMLVLQTCTDFGGSPQGPGSVCEPNQCENLSGACCMPTGECFIADEQICSGFGGAFEGVGTVCDPNPCPPPGPAACCFEDGSCAMFTPQECVNAGGVAWGLGTACDPNPCPLIVPTESTSWGKLKALYR